jgi:hypothetical protein
VRRPPISRSRNYNIYLFLLKDIIESRFDQESNRLREARYRLGYGGGYLDRILAALEPKPLAIGVGFELSRIKTIRP